MLTVVAVYYQAHPGVPSWSRCYTPDWVDKLARGVRRHYSQPFRFVCLTDQDYAFQEPIETQRLTHTRWATACAQALMVEAERLVFMGLDTVIVGSLDDLCAYSGQLAVPRDPYRTGQACNAVVLCPPRPEIAAASAPNDMAVLDQFPHDWLDERYPGQVVSYKAHVRDHGLGDARIVYFHGEPKPSALSDPWVKEHWHAI